MSDSKIAKQSGTLGRPYFAIFAAMRTGSNLLEQSVNQFDDLSCRGELYNGAFIGGAQTKELNGYDLKTRDNDPIGFFSDLSARAPDIRTGFRIFSGHSPAMVDFIAADPACAKVILRRDPLESFVSLQIARKTQQWLLTKDAHRQTGKIVFTPDEYEAYLATLNHFYDFVERRMREAGQTAFSIDYAQLKDLSLINGLAKHLGSAHQLEKLKEPIKKQNPDDMRSKVENYDEMTSYFAGAGKAAPAEVKSGAGFKSLVGAPAAGLIYAPIGASAATEMKCLMAVMNGGAAPEKPGLAHRSIVKGDILLNGDERLAMEALHQTRSLAFTFVKHPTIRAYDAFNDKVFQSHETSYGWIRITMCDIYKLPVPTAEEVALAAEKGWDTLPGYDLAAHRLAFKTFLSFVELNLAGATKIRKDAVWRRQSNQLEKIQNDVVIDFIGRAERLDEDVAYIARRAGREAPADIQNLFREAPPPPFPLEDIHDEEVEELCQAVYRRDYEILGYGPYKP